MAWKKLQKYLPIIIGLVLGVGIVFLNKSMVSRDYKRTKSIVDKNGVLSSGTISEKNTGSKFRKSNVIFYYIYNDSIYFNQDYKFVNNVEVNETVLINIDTTNPARSYIVNTYR